MPFVYSTATGDNVIPVYEQAEPGQAATIKHSVLIRGGANLAKGNKELVTKYGIRTEVSDDDLKLLLADGEFTKMVNRGFMYVDTRKRNAEEVAANMAGRDESAPLTPNDYEAADKEGETVKATPREVKAFKNDSDEDED